MRIVFIAKEPALFDRSEVIGEGKQATLEIAVDETAAKEKWALPTRRREEMPGQIELKEEA